MMEMKLIEGISKYKKIVVEEDGKEIARCYVYIIKNDLHERPYSLIEDVFVDENYRGRGIGSEIVKKAIEVAKEEGCYKIILTSRFENELVHKWYERLGFKRWGYEFRMELI